MHFDLSVLSLSLIANVAKIGPGRDAGGGAEDATLRS